MIIPIIPYEIHKDVGGHSRHLLIIWLTPLVEVSEEGLVAIVEVISGF